MNAVLTVIMELLAFLPAPVVLVIGLGIFIAILVTLLKLIKLILDAIPFV